MEVEEDEDVLMRRQRQLDYGKLTISYRNYRQQIPRRVLTSEARLIAFEFRCCGEVRSIKPEIVVFDDFLEAIGSRFVNIPELLTSSSSTVGGSGTAS